MTPMNVKCMTLELLRGPRTRPMAFLRTTVAKALPILPESVLLESP